MIAFALCIGSEGKLRRYAGPGLQLAAEADSIIVEATADSSLFVAYNEVLDALADVDGLEALVLLHEDVEILVPDFCDRIRRALAEDDVAIAGVVGARDLPNLEWWRGECRGRVHESRGLIDFGGGRHDVDAVDGLLLALSPWAVSNLRFDADGFTGFHGYDVDICLQARAAGRRVIVDDLPVFHHTKGGFGDVAAFQAADTALRRKWSARLRPLATATGLNVQGAHAA